MTKTNGILGAGARTALPQPQQTPTRSDSRLEQLIHTSRTPDLLRMIDGLPPAKVSNTPPNSTQARRVAGIMGQVPGLANQEGHPTT